MTTKLASFIAAIAALILLAGCGEVDVAAERAERARQGKGDVVIGVAWPFATAKGTLWDGVELAQEEVNAAGGVLGRKLVVVKEDDSLSVTKGIAIAHGFANNPDMVAVIGTLNSYISVSTAPVYEFAKLLFMSQGSSANRLTSQGYEYFFRMIPSNRDVGEMLARHAGLRNYKRVLVYYVKNEYGLDLANAFEQRAEEFGVEVVDRVSYLAGAADYKLAMQHWRDFYSFDAIFIAGSLPEGAQIIRAAREIGIQVPIFGGDGLDSLELIRLGGEAVEGTEVISFFHPDEPQEVVAEFNARFSARFGNRTPDTSAALGYDAIKLLADTMNRAGTTEPRRVAEALRATTGWRGVTGEHNFDTAGNVKGKPIVIQVVKDGKFEYATTGY